MEILAHRGYWNEQIKPNSLEAIQTALEHGYGFESDIRDYQGQLVISHDVADHNCENVEKIFRLLTNFQNYFAINIKADGLTDILKLLLNRYSISKYFLFDMSVPQMIEIKDAGLKYFTRQSEVEVYPSLYEEAMGIWIDGFWSTDWITHNILMKHIENEKFICLVSPELHKRNNYIAFWAKIKSYNIDFNRIMLCTDYPDKARKFFNE